MHLTLQIEIFFFSLCGWNNWYAPVGMSIGNSWRIGPDDTNWGGILTNIDINAALFKFAGPGGWNDPCLLLGYDENGTPAITEKQGRAQFTMWAIMASPLLLSQNLNILSPYQLSTYLNTEVIAINQDRLGKQGQKLVGGELSLPNSQYAQLTLQKCSDSLKHEWQFAVQNSFLYNTDSGLCANIDNCGTKLIAYPCTYTGGTCAGPNSYANEEFIYSSNEGTLKSNLSSNNNFGANLCVTHFGEYFPVSLQLCNGESNQQWIYNSTSRLLFTSNNLCLTVGGPIKPRANIWARPLIDGSWAFAFLNADTISVTLTCDLDCLSITGWESNQIIKVRDIWRKMNTNITLNNGITVKNLEPQGGVALLKLTPIY